MAFVLQNYDLAFEMHHTLKRDLQGKELWIHYAGALVSYLISYSNTCLLIWPPLVPTYIQYMYIAICTCTVWFQRK